MILRQQQRRKLTEQSEQALRRRLATTLRERAYPRVVPLNDGQLEHRIEMVLTRARQHGFALDCDLAAYTVLAFGIGPLFDRHPLIAQVLRELASIGQLEMRMVFALVPPKSWEEAAQLSPGSSQGTRPS
jgi:hypothetical protein